VSQSKLGWATCALLCLVVAACSDDAPTPSPDATGNDAAGEDAEGVDAPGEDVTGDITADGEDATGDSGDGDIGDTAADSDGSDARSDGDADSDAEPDALEPLPFPVPGFGAIATAPGSSVLPASVEGCSVIDGLRCGGATLERCAIYDGDAEEWVDEPPRMTEQAFVFDRYFDLYHSPEGQAVDVDFTGQVPPGQPESEWSNPANFRAMDAYGDASGWTGTALLGAASRYRATGTDADYERMLQQFIDMMFMYEVTSIPGMIARSHFAMLPEGAPDPVGHWDLAISDDYPEDGSTWHYHYPIDEALLDRIPDYYTDGITIGETEYATRPRWQGDASRDMYVRSLPGVMMAYDLIGDGEREDALREAVEAELPCTLNRLRMGRIINLQESPDLIEAVTALLGSAAFEPDEGDLDLTTLDTILFFAMEQPNPDHWDRFEIECPDGPPRSVDEEYVLDAADPLFLLHAAALFGRVDRSSDDPIAWINAPSVRGSDLLFMMQWALTAHYLTDDASYLEFVELLMRNTEFEGVLGVYGALVLPKWCRTHFAPSLGYPTFYNLLARISPADDPELWTLLSRTAVDEIRHSELAGADDAFFGILYNRMVSPETDPTGADYVAEHVEILRSYGVDPENHLEPSRRTSINWVDPPVEGVELEYPDDDVYAICEASISVLGIEIPPPGMSDENPRAVDALPLHMRSNTGFIWTQDPWRVLREFGGGEFTVQYPMLGMTVPYWVGRADGVIDEGEGWALAWRPTEEVCPD